MLVLTRRPGQSIIVGEGTELVVVRIEGDRVVLGIDAPREVRVVRAELLRDVETEVLAASSARSRIVTLLDRPAPSWGPDAGPARDPR
jgi:carbon storage regulator